MHARAKNWGKYGGLPLLLMMGLGLLAGCKDTSFGSALEAAIAPASLAPAPTAPTAPAAIALPTDLPPDIPVPAAATLRGVQTGPGGAAEAIALHWQTNASDGRSVLGFYRQALPGQGWQLLRSPDRPDRGTFLATHGDRLLTVSIQPNGNRAEVLLHATRLEGASPRADLLPTATPPASAALDTNDLEAAIATAPEALQPYLRDLAALGVLQARDKPFDPNAPVARGQFALWLAIANNRIYANNPSRQVRLARAGSDLSSFADVPASDARFPAIQGLVNAGVIGGAIGTPARSAALFRPNAPLTREELLVWKVPLDVRQAVPAATAAAVGQAWGFQDSHRIAPYALGAALADSKSGDLSNLRRAFGFTTLLQPQKPVTQAEAAAALWYFGTSGDGLSARDALAIARAADSEPATPSPSPTSTPSLSN